MYHSVAPEIEGWAFSYLSIDPRMFEDHISRLSAAGYVSISLSELHAYMARKGRIPSRALALTFDDGYLDNWVFAFPILRKYGFRATIFVSTDFIDRTDRARPNLADVWEGRSEMEDLEWRGFLCRDEMRRMIESGLIDVEGHCRSHTWYFTSSRIVDFHHPGDPYPWLGWNARPDRKPLYLREDQTGFVPLGSPVYEHRKSVVARRYFPDPAVEQTLADHVAANGAERFFDRPDWRSDLYRAVREARGDRPEGRSETDEEQLVRLREEIVLSREHLEAVIDRPVRFLCWPGGAYDDKAVRLAAEAGYTAYTLSSRDPRPRRNIPGEDPQWMRRIGIPPWWTFRGKKRARIDGTFLEHMLSAYKGFALGGVRLKWHKLGRLVGSYFQ
jgi:peptidoglycan/xylan/chitin deacetylase (PgdA/CDA1 family)